MDAGVALLLTALWAFLLLAVLIEVAATLRGRRREAKEHAAAQLKALEDIRLLAWQAQNPGAVQR